MSSAPEVYVTNFNPNFTGVSATIAALYPHQKYDLRLVGAQLPGCPKPLGKAEAIRMSSARPDGKPFAIWHVRRNTEMRAAIWARDVLRKPIKLVFTSAAKHRHSALPRWLISRMDAVIATSDEAADLVPHVRATVPHGVDTDRFVPSEDRAAAWAKTGYGGKRGVACVGRVRSGKGTDRFVDTMLRVLPEQKDITALVIGRASPQDRGFIEALKRKVAAAGLSDRLLFIGEIGRDEMPALYRSLSLLVPLPRYEPYGLTPIEGMASGVPFVASDTGYFKHFSMDGRAGHVVEAEDAHLLVTELLANPDRLAQLGAEARKVAVETFSIHSEANGISQVYEELWADAR
ncbi:MAG: glycosyltransferase family 4 protein [Pseudomonadota bacterium]